MEALIQKQQKPVIAILTYPDGSRTLRGNKQNFIDLIRAGAQHGAIVYVLTTDEFPLSGDKVAGYTFSQKLQRWKKKLMPLPKVIYNRIPYRKFEFLPDVQQVLQTCMRDNRIHFFNPAFFNKWTLFEWLSKGKETRGMIPATKKLGDSGDLEQLLQEHDCLYLKPVRGKAGKGIMKVAKTTASGAKTKAHSPVYTLSIQDKTRSLVSRYTTVSKLWSEIRALTDGKDYLIQQAISLSKYKQRPFDLRVLVQKNGKGLWSIAGVGARVAGKLSITTHVPRGGSIDDPVKLLEASFGHAGSKRIISKVRRAAIQAARQIEKECAKPLGEMSMDLGVDSNGDIWFFEANSKPMKFDEPPIRRRSLDNLIEYCIHLTQTPRSRTVRSAAKKPQSRSTNRTTRARHNQKAGR